MLLSLVFVINICYLLSHCVSVFCYCLSFTLVHHCHSARLLSVGVAVPSLLMSAIMIVFSFIDRCSPLLQLALNSIDPFNFLLFFLYLMPS